jgi:TP53 regulating kinase-like protein
MEQGKIKGNLIGQGAEAVILRSGDEVVKERVSKGYRHPEIDEELRKTRTRREAKVISKLNEIGVPGPGLKEMDDKGMKVVMEFIDGEKVRDVLHNDPERLGEEIGMLLGKMHNAHIIHHDLTTSNMILRDGKIHFIDFGLSFFSHKPEDKAVDIHLLDRAMESYHHKIYPACFNAALMGYKKSCESHSEVLDRFEQVKARGRNKNKH